MPKGDRLKLKADPEDGTTPIANLLLEAVAMTKLPGLQTRAILYLWRKTYGWIDKDGNRIKKCEIGLTEWIGALDAIKSSVSSALKELESKNIFYRTANARWGTYTYQLNTNIKSWNTDCLNLEKLAKSIQSTPNIQSTLPPQYETAEQSAISHSTKTANSKATAHRTVPPNRTLQYENGEHPTLYKETLNKGKEKKDDKNLSSPTGLKVKEVFERIDKLRGYRPPKRKAEAASIMRMLKTYTPNQIIETWQKLKEDKFWQKKELFMMSVESQIGAVLNNEKTNKQGKHSNMVRR